MSTAGAAPDAARGTFVTVRCSGPERELLDSLMAAHAVASRSEVYRMGLRALAREGVPTRPQLVRVAYEALRAALALPGDGADPTPPAPGCDHDPGGRPCGRPAEWSVRTAGGTRRLCTACLEAAKVDDRRFRRNKAKPIGGAK